MLPLHIILAVLSIVTASFAALAPSRIKLWISYFLTFGTILSGAFLVIESPSYFGKACLSGIFYIGVISALSLITRKRLVLTES